MAAMLKELSTKTGVIGSCLRSRAHRESGSATSFVIFVATSKAGPYISEDPTVLFSGVGKRACPDTSKLEHVRT